MKKGIIASLFLCFTLITIKVNCQESTYLSSDQFINEGIEFHNKGEYENAIKSYKKVSKCDPNYELACYELALTYYYTDKLEDALAKCREVLSFKYDKANLYSLMGSILDEMGKRNEAIELLTDALKKWQYNQEILYSLAVCYLNIDQPLQAEELLIKSILINPYHSRSHLCLAKVNYLMGRIAQSYLAYNMVLLLNPSINNLGAYEEAISQKPKLKTQEYKYPYSVNVNYKKWDEIKGLLQSELAFNEDFDYGYKYNYTSGRQSLMLFQKLTFEPSDTSIYSRLYSRLFVEIKQKFGFETYLNYILKNIKNDDVTNWSDKNKDKLDSFIKWAQTYLNQGRLYGFSYHDEQNKKQTWHYDEEGNLASVGELSGKNGDTKNGTWLTVGDYGFVSEKGTYRNGIEEGEWVVYWPDGSIKNQLNFVNGQLDGLIKVFHPNGTIAETYNFKSGKKEGAKESYTHSGFIVSKNSYSDDLVDGKGVFYNYSEGFKREFSYKNGNLENENIETWFNGNQKQHCFYHNDKQEGVFNTWYSNSSRKSVSNYKNDTLSGEYTEYYPNNQKSKELVYNEKGFISGKIITYDRAGNISSEENGYKNGILTGERIEYFPDGKIQRILTYQNGNLVEVVCLDKKGNQIYKAKDTNSSIYLKSFYVDGIISFEGLLDKGNRQGKWKSYNPLGLVTYESNYSNGLLEGIQRKFYENGQIEKEYSCSDNNILGIYKEYYINGHLKAQGHYDTTGVAGKWIYYYENDTIKDIIFYKNGKLAGRKYNFEPDGKLKSEEFFDNEGNSTRVREFKDDSSILSDIDYRFGSQTFEIKFPDGKLKEKKNFADNVLQGNYEEYYPNGQLAIKAEYSHNLVNGQYRKWDHKGNLTYEIPLIMGLAEGEGKWYIDNVLDFKAYYEQDKLQGIATRYFYNGQIARKSMYVDDERNGNSDYFSPDGILMYRLRFIENTIKAYSYLDKSGNMVPEIPITDTTSAIIAYYPNGKISARISLCKGLYHGKFISYYSSGSVLQESMFKFDQIEGYDKSYFPNNKLRQLINYKSDCRQGLYELYYENGKKKNSGNYFMDRKEGEWKTYNSDGAIKEVLTYRKGTLNDIKKL